MKIEYGRGSSSLFSRRIEFGPSDLIQALVFLKRYYRESIIVRTPSPEVVE
jgi:hypothetical protein